MSAKTPNRPASVGPSKPRDMIRVRALAALEACHAAAAAAGTDKLTDEEIQAEIDAVRAEMRAKVGEAVAALRAAGRSADERALFALSIRELDDLISATRSGPSASA